ncbi:MAG: radical SAM protein [Candidatus Sericytochromatia bacterium]|nr:radical SAM protein [Candidatus Sericytochromatia bacterium]
MTAAASTVYGPVDSWRLGRSLGIDVLFNSSICSFRCVYCQLGRIETPTRERRVWVETARVVADLERADWRSAEVVTFSGSGEPTLAANLAEVIRAVKARTGKPVVVLTNATLLEDPEVRRDLRDADRVFCKLDAVDQQTLEAIDRPVPGVTHAGIVAGIKALRREHPGFIAVQSMFMPANRQALDRFAALLRDLAPDEVQLNTPTRPVPRGWFLEARGNYSLADAPYEAVALRHLDRDEARTLADHLRAATGLPITSIYRDPDPSPSGDKAT